MQVSLGRCLRGVRGNIIALPLCLGRKLAPVSCLLQAEDAESPKVTCGLVCLCDGHNQFPLSDCDELRGLSRLRQVPLLISVANRQNYARGEMTKGEIL